MRLVISAIGINRRGSFKDAVDDYAARIKRAGPGVGISDIDIKEWDAPKALQGPARQAAEAERLIKMAGEATHRVALDERGKSVNSLQFAEMLSDWRDAGAREVAFFIGGADGLSADLRQSADRKISFGSLTWPHQLARVMLYEQLYRAVTILSGHPYHRE